jgi:hypothetical protein
MHYSCHATRSIVHFCNFELAPPDRISNPTATALHVLPTVGNLTDRVGVPTAPGYSTVHSGNWKDGFYKRSLATHRIQLSEEHCNMQSTACTACEVEHCATTQSSYNCTCMCTCTEESPVRTIISTQISKAGLSELCTVAAPSCWSTLRRRDVRKERN